MIQITKPFLPPKEEYFRVLDEIWSNCWVTNNGPILRKLESGLKDYLNLNNLLVVSNGTIAIQIAIKALELEGEIITTPFSYVATTSSIVWENCTPVFVDINEFDFNIDADKIEASITPETRAILATHVFGNACQIKKIEKIATSHNLKVIYDAAHCFGTRYGGKSIFGYGDVSTASFHATKLFNTVEGGAVFTDDSKLLTKMSFMRNFGHDGPLKFASVGINGKNSELHAAMGLVNLNYIDSLIKRRKAQWLVYEDLLSNSGAQLLKINEDCCFNHAYFPIVFESEEKLLEIEQSLNAQQIFPRRYFNPSLNLLNYIEHQPCPVSESICSRVLTLPLYHDLPEEDIRLICNIIQSSLSS